MKYLVRLSFALLFLHCILAGCADAQTVDLSTDEAVVEQFGRQKNEKITKNDVCIKRSAKIIVIGLMGCRFHAAFVNSVYLEEGADLSKNALNALGWKEANQKEREELAKLWVDKGLLAFSTVIYAKVKNLSDDKFHPPQVVSRKNGEVVVSLWVSFERRKLGRKVNSLTKGFRQYEYQFAQDGNSSERVTHEILVP